MSDINTEIMTIIIVWETVLSLLLAALYVHTSRRINTNATSIHDLLGSWKDAINLCRDIHSSTNKEYFSIKHQVCELEQRIEELEPKEMNNLVDPDNSDKEAT